MCGIAGVVRRGAPIVDCAAVSAAFDAALAHRGPDGAGVWLSDRRDVLMVHRRLAIIDLSPAAAQPMASAGADRMIVFNGEVYNHRELRRDLEARGERFRTQSDTEVLLRLLVVDGPAALARVRGMFAFALWDVGERTLLLARDRFGIKPLYVTATDDSLAFASELSALRAARLVDSTISPAAALAFLAWGSVPPPLAWNQGVEMLEPGTWLEWRPDGRDRRGRFADARLAYRSASDRQPLSTADDFRARVGAAVRESVRAHLVADVPVGVFLSGGLDSSAIVSAAASVGAPSLNTFTVTFDDPSSEAAYAREVASAFGTSHHELTLDGARIVRDCPDIVSRLDQPSIDAVNSYYVSQAVASTGIKAVLSGTGGDELFGGYPSFRRIPAALRLKRAAGPMMGMFTPLVAYALPSRLQPQWRHFAATNGDAREAYRTQRGLFMPHEILRLARPALAQAESWRDAWQTVIALDERRLSPIGAAGEETAVAGVARMELTHYLASQLLRDVDVMSMAHGLEVRVPFVDHELTSAIWPALGRHEALMRGKRALGTTLERPLPPAIAARPKQGFILPFARWMRGELLPFVEEGLRRLAGTGWVDKDEPVRVWREWHMGRTHWTRPWGLAVLGAMAGGPA